MKKAIRIAIALLAASLLAVSCSKTASNTFALLGEWKLIQTERTINGHTESIPLDRYINITFCTDDVYFWEETGISGLERNWKGYWYVEDDNLTLTRLGDESLYFRIEKTGLSRLVLSETCYEDGVTVIYRDTYKYVSSY